MSDLIEKQAAIDALNVCATIGRGCGKSVTFDIVMATVNDYADIVKKRIEALPSAQPERKQGKWKDFCGSYQCSCCNMTNAYEENFCPNCGADMRCNTDDKK